MPLSWRGGLAIVLMVGCALDGKPRQATLALAIWARPVRPCNTHGLRRERERLGWRARRPRAPSD